MKWINKYWRAIIVVMSILLIVCIVLLIRSDIRYNEAMKLNQLNVEFNKKALAEYKATALRNQQVMDSLTKVISEKNVIIIKEETRYETVKKSPININYSSDELREYVKSLESEYKNRHNK